MPPRRAASTLGPTASLFGAFARQSLSRIRPLPPVARSRRIDPTLGARLAHALVVRDIWPLLGDRVGYLVGHAYPSRVPGLGRLPDPGGRGPAPRPVGLLDDQVGRLWQLWPLILIGIGVGLVLSRTRFDFVGGLIVAATFGLMVGGLLSLGFIPVSSGVCGQQAGSVAVPDPRRHLRGLGLGRAPARLRRHDRRGRAGNAWHVDGTDADGHGPTITSSDSTLTVHSPERRRRVLGLRRATVASRFLRPRRSISTSSSTPVSDGRPRRCRLAGGRRRAQRRFGDGRPRIGQGDRRARRDLNAGSLGLTLPNLSLTGTIQANAGSVRLCAPPGAALRLQTGENIVASYDYARSRPGQGWIDLDDAGLRQRHRPDRTRDHGQRGLVRAGPGGRM